MDNRELKQRQRRRQQQRQKKAIGLEWQINNFTRASLSFVHFFADTAQLRRETSGFMFYGGREHETKIFSFFFLT